MIRLPKTKRGLFSYLVFIFLTTFSIFLTSNTSPLQKTVKAPTTTKTPDAHVLSLNEEVHLVSRVIDGDTLVIETGEKVRLIGIDAPELKGKSSECYATESEKYLSNLVLNKELRFVKDVSEKDNFGRLLRYAYIKDVFINQDLVTSGYARAVSYSPDTKYSKDFKTAQDEAFLSKLGIWSDRCIKASK